jgi:protein gp37
MEKHWRGGHLPVKFRADRLNLPRHRKASAWAVWADLFHEVVTDDEISRTMHIADLHPRERFLVLTKRAERIAKWSVWFGDWPRNVWAGVTVCNQAEADAKIPLLLRVPAAVRFLSIEPMLGPVDLSPWLGARPGCEGAPANLGCDVCREALGLSWVIVGGESGPGARPMHPDWVRSIRDQCVAAGVPFFFKNHGDAIWRLTRECRAAGAYGEDCYLCDYRRVLGLPETTCPADLARANRKHAGRLLSARAWSQMPGGGE